MDYRNLLGFATVVFSAGYFVRSFQPANASMPVGMQHGQFPYEHFTECDLPGATVSSSECTPSNGTYTLLTVPNDRIFIVTGAATSDYYSRCHFMEDGTILIDRDLISRSSYLPVSPMVSGNAHLAMPAGSSLQIQVNDNGCDFYIEGYYAHL